MLPINQMENSRRVLATMQYQTEKYRVQEDIWLCKYLKMQGFTKEQVYSVWKKMFLQRATHEISVSDIKGVFAEILRCSSKIKLKEPKSVVITREDIDTINGIPCPLWMKQYAMLLLVYARTTGEDTFVPPENELIPLVYTKQRGIRPSVSVRKVLLQNGFLEEVLVSSVWKDAPIVSSETNLVSGFEEQTLESELKIKVIPFKVNPNSDVVIVLGTFFDATNGFEFLTEAAKCRVCGKMFVPGKHKLDVCKCCAREEGMRREAAAKREFRNSRHTE